MTAAAVLERVRQFTLAPVEGRVVRLSGSHVEADGPPAALGDHCEISAGSGGQILAEVTAVHQDRLVLMPVESASGLLLGARVRRRADRGRMPAGDGFAGRAIDALGRPIDGAGPILAQQPVNGDRVPAMLERGNPRHVLPTGLRAIDSLLTIGVGQRIGVFAASGVGKTSLIDQLVRQITADRLVLCLVGERGREVTAFWETLSAPALKARTTLVAATSDASAVLRARAPLQALALAEHWRDKGEHVLLVIDSVTRLAMAQREIGLASGEPPTVRAYTPNVFRELPRLVERCGALASGGAITAVMTVLSETDDVDDPIVELMKSLLDGHIVLSRALAEQGHFPAIDVARSVSRQASTLVPADHAAAARAAIAHLATWEEARVMIESGIYKAGANPAIDRAIAVRPGLMAFLRQAASETTGWEAMRTGLSNALAAGGGHAA